MDGGLLNLGEEHFSTFNVDSEVYGSLPDTLFDMLPEQSPLALDPWDDEGLQLGDSSQSPEIHQLPTLDDDDFGDADISSRVVIDWCSYFNYFGNEDGSSPPKPPTSDFDLTAFINQPEDTSLEPAPTKKVKAPVKKLDVNAQRYIVEDNHVTQEEDTSMDTSDDLVDVETVDSVSLPLLEATDAMSLLKQFEATESANMNNSYPSITSTSLNFNLMGGLERTTTDLPMQIFEPTQNEEKPKVIEQKTIVKKTVKTEKVKEIKAPLKSEPKPKNKQILEALPPELIARINESGKRKPITVIPPLAANTRKRTRVVETHITPVPAKVPKVDLSQKVHLDHDYCASSKNPPQLKEPKKDSGFSSEDDDRNIIRNQPTVKNADGKLMVSLLKVNTIRNNQKKKLNLEEYKKRRFLNSNATSLSNSPISSTCSSPLPEDENLRRLKHQEKLMKMATELLNTPAKSAVPTVPPKPKENKPKVVIAVPVVKGTVLPPDMEMKEFVSIGTNTEESVVCNKEFLASAQQLEEIKPLLKKASDKINKNSFINELIENIPRVKNVAKPVINKFKINEVVREDKIIQYLRKDRIPVPSSSVGVQTDFDEFIDESRYRRRDSRSPSLVSLSSGTSSHGRDRHNASRSSWHSSRRSRSSSSQSSASSTRSRSRSISPRRSSSRNYQVEAEQMREIEERRVLYVGRIAANTTKEDLRRRFQRFGTITNVSLHFREHKDSYGFVTFSKREDAYNAKESGNNDNAYPQYELSFGGRRVFCQNPYSDLDNVREDEYGYRTVRAAPAVNTFDELLRAAQEKLRQRKS